MAGIGLSGGDRLRARLREISERIEGNKEVRVGFLPQNDTYADGTSVALVAAVQEFGAPSKGIPARPFFRGMIAEKSPGWADALGEALVAKQYEAGAALAVMGEGIKWQLQRAIVVYIGTPLAAATVAAKGNDKQLIDTGFMLQSVDYKVSSS